jgi:hypothetical protein
MNTDTLKAICRMHGKDVFDNDHDHDRIEVNREKSAQAGAGSLTWQKEDQR